MWNFSPPKISTQVVLEVFSTKYCPNILSKCACLWKVYNQLLWYSIRFNVAFFQKILKLEKTFIMKTEENLIRS